MPAIDNATQPTTAAPNAAAETEKKAKKPIRQVKCVDIEMQRWNLVVLN